MGDLLDHMDAAYRRQRDGRQRALHRLQQTRADLDACYGQMMEVSLRAGRAMRALDDIAPGNADTLIESERRCRIAEYEAADQGARADALHGHVAEARRRMEAVRAYDKRVRPSLSELHPSEVLDDVIYLLDGGDIDALHWGQEAGASDLAARGRALIAHHGSVSAALMATHPDRGGAPDGFAAVQAARNHNQEA